AERDRVHRELDAGEQVRVRRPLRHLLLEESGHRGETEHDDETGGDPADPRAGTGVFGGHGTSPCGMAPTSTRTSSTKPTIVAAQSSSIRSRRGRSGCVDTTSST